MVAAVLLIAIVSFFFLFTRQNPQPYLLSFPFVFWIGIVNTTLLVVLTYFGARNFPFKDPLKP